MKSPNERLKEEFKKLRQLDRIEYRQRSEIIVNSFRFDQGILVSFVLFLLVISGLSFMTAFLGAADFGDSWFYLFYGISKFLASTSFAIMVFFIIGKIIWLYHVQADLSELNKEYFPKLFKGDRE